MAGVTGLEPAASGVTGRRSNQTELHPRKDIFRPPVGPSGPGSIVFLTPWVSTAIGSLAGAGKMVGGDGIEPPTYWM